jgi:diaminopimelate epimerase
MKANAVNALRLRFTKMHGQGNDFVMLNGIAQKISLSAEQIRFIANRHFGIGCDQVLLVEASDDAEIDFRYRIFNADGSEVEQCGNGARCFVQFVRDEGLTPKSEIRVQTLGGIISPRVEPGGVISVDMGRPRFEPSDIPFAAKSTEQRYALTVGGIERTIGAVSMGNPHAVMVVENASTAPVEAEGPVIEKHPRFPKHANVGFMQVIDRNHIKLRVWERGVGETFACGTGACAAVACGIQWGLLDAKVSVATRGGKLGVRWNGGKSSVRLAGRVTTVFKSEITL